MTLHYRSTRGRARAVPFGDVLLAGLAPDGGLYVPDRFPELPPSWAAAEERGYAAVAAEVMWPYVEGSIPAGDWHALVSDTYGPTTFEHPDVVPVRALGDDLYLAELFGGPTLAFKDIALQLVGRLFDWELGRRGERVTVVGATSGDTGSAAIEALRDREAVDCVILHPHGRVSDVQRRQMTTVPAANIANLAVDGTFDDCQDLVKAMFADEPFRQRLHLSAVNSINWARVLAQIVYYVTAAAAVGASAERPVTFVVPTGNFGNVYAGHVARRMGLPIDRLVVASNRNDVLTRFFDSGTLAAETVVPTYSPSMDIQVSSNLERLLWEVLEADDGNSGTNGGGAHGGLTDLLGRFRRDGTVTLDPERMAAVRDGFAAHRADDDATLEAIEAAWVDHGILVDPHTAVGLAAVRATAGAPGARQRAPGPVVVLATAHPAKFPDAVERATGIRPPLPARLADLAERPERFEVVANDLTEVQHRVAEHARVASA